MNHALARAAAFAARFGLRLPVLQAPMAGVPSIGLAAGVAAGGGLASLGALLLEPAGLADWCARFRAAAPAAPLHINLWVPDPAPVRDANHEARLRDFLARHGPAVAAEAGDARPPDFDAQLAAALQARPAVLSTIMGLLSAAQRKQVRAAGVTWFATVSTVAEAHAALQAGADALIAQGAEAGGHRGAFDAATARERSVGLMALLPAVADAAHPVGIPVLAAGGISDARSAAAALLLGADALVVGSALLRCPEAGIAPVWQAALATTPPEGSQLTRAFSGRWGRALATAYVQAAAAPGAPEPAPYPVQRGLTAAMRKAAEAQGDLDHLQAWAGQGAARAQPAPAAEWVTALWGQTQSLLAS
jgi:nitronate monooxygenase